MSCCGGSASDGGIASKGCKMDPDTSLSEKTTTEAPVLGVATEKVHDEGAEIGAGAENGGCKCNPCTCDPCNCK